MTEPPEPWYDLTLFVNGASVLSVRAIADARRLCDDHLDGRYRLSIVDLREDLSAVVSSHVLAAPTLVKNRPLPVRKRVGDLSDTNKVLLSLDLPIAEVAPNVVS